MRAKEDDLLLFLVESLHKPYKVVINRKKNELSLEIADNVWCMVVGKKSLETIQKWGVYFKTFHLLEKYFPFF